MISNDIDHDSTFWGIRFPTITLPFHQSAVDIVEKYLEGGRLAVLQPGLQRLDLTKVLTAVVCKPDGKWIEHIIVFEKPVLTGSS